MYFTLKDTSMHALHINFLQNLCGCGFLIILKLSSPRLLDACLRTKDFKIAVHNDPVYTIPVILKLIPIN